MSTTGTTDGGPTLKRRPSKLPLALACPASHYPGPDDVLIDVAMPGGAGAVGVAVHAAAAQIVRGELYDLPALAVQNGVREEDLRFLVWATTASWESIEARLPDITDWRTEVEMSMGDPLAMSGTADIIAYDPVTRTVVVIDLKTGWVRRNYTDQIRAYGRMALTEYPEAERVVAGVIWARDGEFDTFIWSRDELETWAAESRETIWGWDRKTYVVEDPEKGLGHCSYCPRMACCPGHTKAVSSGVSMILRDAVEGLELTPARIAELWPLLTPITNAVDAIRSRVKERMAATGESYPMADGRVLILKEENGPSKLDPGLTRTVMVDGWDFSDDDFLACVDIRKKAVLDMVGGRAARGNKGAEKERAENALEKAGALTRTKRQTARVVKASLAAALAESAEKDG